VLEGTAFAMRDVVERLAALGVPTDRLRLMGGGARSDVWCRIRSDVAGRAAEILSAADASATGAGVIAAVAIGTFPDIANASSALPLAMREIVPDTGLAPTYADAYRRYRERFAALEPGWRI
jgi:xylulokinase